MANTLTIQKQDITKMAVDCIVNAANAHLQHGGGVCGAIFLPAINMGDALRVMLLLPQALS